MTDAHLPPDDELVSAHLDGEASAAESARVVGDPAWAARARELAAIRALVAEPVSPRPEQREAAIGAALEVFDALATGTSAETSERRDQGVPAAIGQPPDAGEDAATEHGSTVGSADRPSVRAADDLAARRTAADDARRARRNGALLAAAAVVLLVVLGAGVLARTLTTRQADVNVASAPTGAAPSTTADASKRASGPMSAGNGTSGGAAAGSEGQPAPTTAPAVTTTSRPSAAASNPPSNDAASAPSAPRDTAAATYRFQSQSLGSLSTPAQVRTSVIDALGAPGSPATTTSAPARTATAADVQALAAVSRCDATIRGTDDEVGPIVLSAPVTYRGASAVVLVYAIDQAAHPAANGASRIYTVDAATCAPLDVQTG